MRNRIAIMLLLLIDLAGTAALCQKKIAVLGSSTAAGNGASVFDSSWVGRLQKSFRKNTSDGMDTIVDDRAVAGYVTYQSLPTSYPVPANRPLPDPYHNVTYVLNDVPRADIVIINYPTNDIVNGYDPKEEMDNLRIMYQQLTSHGITCYIATSQPRNGSTNDSTRAILRQLVDSINNNFGYFAINFWTDLVTNDGTNMLRSDLTPDGIHPNDTGHRFLFQRVQAKGLFVSFAPLPVVIDHFSAGYQNNAVLIKWSVSQQDPAASYEIQRSPDGIVFTTIFKTTSNGNSQKADYQWTDPTPLQAKNFYRLKINGQAGTTYSRVVTVNGIINGITIQQLYQNGSMLHVVISSNRALQAELMIINFSGAVVEKRSVNLTSSTTDVQLPVSNLAAGNYFLKLNAKDRISLVQQFRRFK